MTAAGPNSPTTSTIEGAGGLPLVINRSGPAGGAPVLLLHGGGQNRHAWKVTAERLAIEGFDVIAADARGHGDSGWSEAGHYDMDYFADDVEHLITHFDRPPAVVGASMGGMCALLAQGRTGDQLFSAVVLVDVTPRLEIDGVERIVGFMGANPDGFDSLEAAAEVIAAYNPHRERPKTFDGLRKVLRQRDGRWHWRWDPRFITGKADTTSADSADRAIRMKQMADQMHQAAALVTAPTLLVRGGDSDLVSAESVREFLAVVPHAEYVDVSGAGHMVAGDDNDAFTNAVLDFLIKASSP
ncbi:MAG: alpha/beta hydrolase [Actinomycetia bacterium]|nr:alpha/beta hydrolase [Actinomycetes bacterium]